MFKYIIVVLGCVLGFTSCQKYLEAKSDQKLATPSTLADLEAILNNSDINRSTVLLNGMADEYYFIFSDYQTRIELQQMGYIWHPNLNDYNDWQVLYRAAFNANTVLFNLNLIKASSDEVRKNEIKGAALFYRALAFYRVAQLYASQYDLATANSELGIPLRLTADINEESVRSSLQQTYDRIILDLMNAVNLVRNNIPTTAISKTTPSKAACYGLLARTYLQMGEYTKAKDLANTALQIYSILMDFNDADWVKPASNTPFTVMNPEIIFYSMTNASPNSNSRAKVDSNLYKSYMDDDLRKKAFFRPNTDGFSFRFKGSYSGNSADLFCGIATDELFLIRAECYAREGNLALAMQDLNDLLRTRWTKVNGISTYVDRTAINNDDALSQILAERKKELVNREIRWSDLKRLNKQPSYATPLSRELNGQTYLLPPNDLRYVLLIPEEVMRIANLQQNPR